MLVADVFKVYLYADPLVALTDRNYPYEYAEDITSGILNVNIVQGTDIYEGPQEQIDTGQFTIVTRNPNMDPKINPNLKYNSAIKFRDERSGEFFRGYVTDVQVEYQREDDPIITITGTDIFGAMQRVVVDQDTHDAIMALSTGPTWNGLTFSEFLPYMNDFTSKYLDLEAFQSPGSPLNYGFWFPSTGTFGQLTLGNLGYSPAKYIPQIGESYLEVINKYAQTNLTSFTAKGEFGYDYINVDSFVKYDPNFWGPQENPYSQYTTYDFSSDPADGRPYRTILIDNGYNRVINQVDISNEYRFVDTGELKSQSEGFTRISDESIEDYAISRASISTIYPDDAVLSSASWANRYSENIFQVTQFPGQEIQQITFNNARYEDIEDESSYSAYELNRVIRIKHKINNDETIDRIYNIAGITHNIAPDNWEMGFTLKPSKEELIFQYQGSIPTLEMNATSGDSNFNFTATLVDFDPDRVLSVIWALSATDANEIASIWPYATSGNMFENGLPRSGFTQTWNFDDDGILAPYSFDPDSTYEDPTDNRYGGYGSGNWTVYAYIQLTNRFTVVLQQPLVVGTPEVEADFGWVQNLTNNFGQVSFIDTSVNHETGQPNSYSWDFGDGTTSNERNPIHQYNPSAPSENEYDVSLTVFAYGEGGVEVPDTKTETITLVQPEMTADYTFSVFGNDVTFTNTSTNVGFEEPDAYLWDFDDGTTSNQKNPFHVFPAPEDETLTFDVTLTIRNIWEQTESITKTVTIVSQNATGSMPVRYLQFRKGTMYGLLPGEYGPSGERNNNLRITPWMKMLKARTSKTKANLSYLKPVINLSRTNVRLPDGFISLPSNALTGGGYVDIDRINTALDSDFKFTLDFQTPTNNINDMLIDLGIGAYQAATVYCEVDIFTTLETGTLTDPDTATWFKIGSIEIGREEIGSVAEGVYLSPKTIPTVRPMPLNIPYFYYTITNQTASFTSTETADSYYWTFGDGTTSTLKDPVKTFPGRGTYTVTLEVTNDSVVTRTTTEPVIIKSIVPFNTRYVKFVQNEHTGTHAYDTPTISSFKAIKGPNFLPVSLSKDALVDFQYEDYPTDFYYSRGNFPATDGLVLISNLASTTTLSTLWGNIPANQTLCEQPSGSVYRKATTYNAGPGEPFTPIGIRVKTLDASFRTSWSAVVDLQVAHEGIEDFSVSLRRDPIVSAGLPAASGVTYSVYVTDVTSNTINPLTATWTKVGDFVPTGIPVSTFSDENFIPNSKTYNIIPE
jgi:PKD repeat protein